MDPARALAGELWRRRIPASTQLGGFILLSAFQVSRNTSSATIRKFSHPPALEFYAEFARSGCEGFTVALHSCVARFTGISEAGIRREVAPVPARCPKNVPKCCRTLDRLAAALDALRCIPQRFDTTVTSDFCSRSGVDLLEAVAFVSNCDKALLPLLEPSHVRPFCLTLRWPDPDFQYQRPLIRQPRFPIRLSWLSTTLFRLLHRRALDTEVRSSCAPLAFHFTPSDLGFAIHSLAVSRLLSHCRMARMVSTSSIQLLLLRPARLRHPSYFPSSTNGFCCRLDESVLWSFPIVLDATTTRRRRPRLSRDDALVRVSDPCLAASAFEFSARLLSGLRFSECRRIVDDGHAQSSNTSLLSGIVTRRTLSSRVIQTAPDLSTLTLEQLHSPENRRTPSSVDHRKALLSSTCGFITSLVKTDPRSSRPFIVAGRYLSLVWSRLSAVLSYNGQIKS